MSDEVPQEKLEQYKKLIESHPEMELKGGKKLPYTSMNGNMYTMLTKDGRVGLRMGKADREAFNAKYDKGPFKNYGAVMREYVELPDSLLQDADACKPYLEMSHEYAKTLKAKPTKKK